VGHLLLQRLHRQHGPREARGALSVPVARLDAQQPQRCAVGARPTSGPSKGLVRTLARQRMPQRADLNGVAQRRARPVHGHAADGVRAQPCAARCGPLLAAAAPPVPVRPMLWAAGMRQCMGVPGSMGACCVAVVAMISDR